MVCAYWRRVWRRAWQDTLRALALDLPERAVLRIVAAAIGVAGVWWVTSGDTPSELVVRTIATAAILALLPVVLFWKLIVKPAQIDAEAQGKIADLNLKIEDREKIKQLRQAIWHLREEGVALRNKGLKTSAVVNWAERFDEWHSTLLERAAALSPDLRHSLDPLDNISPENIERIAVLDANHQKMVSAMSEKLARLYTYLNKSMTII